MLFAILRSSILCLRGSRTKWRCLRLEIGSITWLINELNVFVVVVVVVVLFCFLLFFDSY